MEDGPELVEGNGAPDLDIIQRTHRAPIGNARLGELLAFHLRDRLAATNATEHGNRSRDDTIASRPPEPVRLAWRGSTSPAVAAIALVAIGVRDLRSNVPTETRRREDRPWRVSPRLPTSSATIRRLRPDLTVREEVELHETRRRHPIGMREDGRTVVTNARGLRCSSRARSPASSADRATDRNTCKL